MPPRLYNVSFVPPSTQGSCSSTPRTDLETVRIPGVSITAGRSGLDAVLRSAFVVSGLVLDPGSAPVASVDLNFYQSATGFRQIVSRDNTAPDGTFAIYVPPGTYDIVYGWSSQATTLRAGARIEFTPYWPAGGPWRAGEGAGRSA